MDPTTPKPRGGKRPGAGRKTKAERNAGKTLAIEEQIAAYAPTALASLKKLAEGVTVVTKQKYAAACTLKQKDVVRDKDGVPLPCPKTGKFIVIEALIFPNAGPDQMILVGEEKITGDLDFKANEYLLNRALGRPPETPTDSGNGINIDEALEEAEAMAEGYRDPDQPGGPSHGPGR
jgi:hypothetical protein